MLMSRLEQETAQAIAKVWQAAGLAGGQMVEVIMAADRTTDRWMLRAQVGDEWFRVNCERGDAPLDRGLAQLIELATEEPRRILNAIDPYLEPNAVKL